jgi:serine/threonine protein kinase
LKLHIFNCFEERNKKSYLLKGSDLWIVMEYCGGGSVSDIMRMRKKTLTEDEISTILRDTLLGLEYLHARRKIHRDIKAGNILLNSEGHGKLGHYRVISFRFLIFLNDFFFKN